MENFYRLSCQKILFFCLLLLSSQLTFAQTLPDPTGLPPNQIVCYDESVTLTGSCSSGNLHWYDEAYDEVTNPTFNVTETATYFAVCESSCSCEMSNSIPVTITVNTPTNVTRDQSICHCGNITLTASCPRGNVAWYGSDTTLQLSSAVGIGTFNVEPFTDTPYFVRCEDAANSCNSPFKEVNIYVNTEMNDPPTNLSPTVAACAGSDVILSADCTSGASAFFFLNDEVTEVSSLIQNVSTSATYKVRCESFTNCPSSFVPLSLNVYAAPVPTGVISGSTECKGTSVELTASCDIGYDVVWYNNDESIPLASNVVVLDSDITYKVRCETYGCFSTFESVSFVVKNHILAEPSSVLLCLGDNASFTTNADATLVTPTYQWQKKQTNGTYLNIASATTHTLTINNTTLADGGYYRCHVVGNCDFYTEDAFLAFPQSIVEKGKLVPPQVTSLNEFGNASAISDSLAVVGAWGKNAGRGAAYIFKMNAAGKWSQLAQLAPSDLLPDDIFGTSVAISGDTVFVGAPGQDNAQGAVYIYKKQTNTTWTIIDKLVVPFGGSDDYFGISLSVSSGLLAVGSDEWGSVYVYKRNNAGEWIYEEELYDGDPDNYFGHSVGLSGNSLVVGAPDQGANGAIYIYERNNTGTWQLQTVFAPNNLSSGVVFGFASAISGNTIVASGFNSVSGESTVNVYERGATGVWHFKSTLNPDDLAEDAGFGFSLAIHDNRMVVGSPGNLFGKGASTIFEKDVAGNWIKKKTIAPADLISGDRFGTSVAISKTSMVVGASFTIASLPVNFSPGGAYFYGIHTYPVPVVSTVLQTVSACPTQAGTFVLSGLPSIDPYTITYKIDVAGTEKTVVVTPDSTGKATISEALAWASNTKNIYITKVKNNITGCEKSSAVSAIITVKSPTVVTGHPDNQTLCIGETAVFTAEATGEGILTFQWQRLAPGSSSDISGFSDLSVLTLGNRTMADSSARYRVKVTGECGVVTSNEAILTVLRKAIVNIASGSPICPGTSGTLTFTGTPEATVVYQVDNEIKAITLDTHGTASVSTGNLSQNTEYSLLSIDLMGKCSQRITGSVVVEVLTIGSNPPLTLTSPLYDVLPSGNQTHTAQTITAINKIGAGGKATYIGNQTVIMEPGFEAKSGSVYTARVSAACL